MVYCDGWWWIESTRRDDDANGAHTKDPQMDDMQMENTKDLLTDEAVMSCELLISYMICAEWLKMEYFTLRILFQSWYSKDPPWQMTLQMEQGSMDGWSMHQTEHTQSTSRIQWRMTQQTEHTNDPLMDYSVC